MDAVVVGDKFGTRTVVAIHGSRIEYVCTCGHQSVADLSHLRRYPDGTCRRCATRQHARRTHGQSVRRPDGKRRTPEYAAWSSMIQRCTDPNCVGYKDYGARGISVHPDWLGEHGFEKFFAHVGTRPSAQHSIDRRNNLLGYWPGNVRWATKKEQQRNRRNNHLLTAGGVTLCVAEWAENLGCSPSVIHDRLEDGWPPEKAALTPVKKYAPRRKTA